jgi:hypothetical protein
MDSIAILYPNSFNLDFSIDTIIEVDSPNSKASQESKLDYSKFSTHKSISEQIVDLNPALKIVLKPKLSFYSGFGTKLNV